MTSDSPAALIAAVLALLGTFVMALVQVLGKRSDTRLGLMELLQRDNAELREQLAVSRRREWQLEAALRLAKLPIPEPPEEHRQQDAR